MGITCCSQARALRWGCTCRTLQKLCIGCCACWVALIGMAVWSICWGCPGRDSHKEYTVVLKAPMLRMLWLSCSCCVFHVSFVLRASAVCCAHLLFAARICCLLRAVGFRAEKCAAYNSVHRYGLATILRALESLIFQLSSAIRISKFGYMYAELWAVLACVFLDKCRRIVVASDGLPEIP